MKPMTDISSERNRKCIRSFFEALQHGDADTIKAQIADDVVWEVVGVGVKTKEDICQGVSNTIATTTRRHVSIQCLLVEGNTGHAFVETLFTYKDNRQLLNRLSLSYQFEGGRIKQCTEFMDLDKVRAFFSQN
jgi:ketosteroid isomerase-like protein